MVNGDRLGAGGGDDIYNGRQRASSTYADRSATAAVVIATSDVTDCRDDDDGRTVLTSHHGGAMATNCLCRYRDDDAANDDVARLGPLSCRPPSNNRLESRPGGGGHAAAHWRADHLVRPS